MSTGPSSWRYRILYSSLGSGIAMVCGASAGLIVARVLGPEGKGEQALVAATAMALGTLCSGGLQFWALHSLPSGTPLRNVLDIYKRHVLQVVIVVAALGAALSSIGAHYWNIPLSLSIFCALQTLLILGQILAFSIPNGLQEMRIVGAAQAAGGLAYFLAALFLLIFSIDTVPPALAAASLGMAISIPIAMRAIPKPHIKTNNTTKNTTSYFGALRMGLPGSVGEIIASATQRFDFVLLGVIADARAVSLYAVATALTEFLWIVPNGVAQVHAPHVASGATSDTPPVVTLVAIVLAVGAGLLWLLSDFVIEVTVGRAFAEASRAIPALGVAAVSLGIWKIINADLNGRGITSSRAVSAAASLLVMTLVDLVLIPKWGIVGAGIGAFAGYSTATLISALKWSAVTGEPLYALIRVQPLRAVRLLKRA